MQKTVFRGTTFLLPNTTADRVELCVVAFLFFFSSLNLSFFFNCTNVPKLITLIVFMLSKNNDALTQIKFLPLADVKF